MCSNFVEEMEEEMEFLRDKIDEFEDLLDDREGCIFKLRIISDTPATLQEIGDIYDISRERVRQVEELIIKKFRVFLNNE